MEDVLLSFILRLWDIKKNNVDIWRIKTYIKCKNYSRDTVNRK